MYNKALIDIKIMMNKCHTEKLFLPIVIGFDSTTPHVGGPEVCSFWANITISHHYLRYFKPLIDSKPMID